MYVCMVITYYGRLGINRYDCFFPPCSADHERDWPPCKVVFFGLATNALNVRNNNNNNNNNPARGQLNRENVFSPSPFASENLVSRDKIGSYAPLQLAHSPHPG